MKNITTLILCGGRGERLIPLTDTTQKCMLPVQGRPFLEYIVEQIKSFGLQKIVFCCGYRGDDIINHFDSGPVYEPNYEFSFPSEFINTGARVLKTIDLIDTNDIAVFNGDSLCVVSSDQFKDVYTMFIRYKEVSVKLLIDGNFSLLSSFVPGPFDNSYGSGIYFFKKNYLKEFEYDPNLSLEDDIILNTATSYYKLPESCYTIDIGTLENYRRVNDPRDKYGRILIDPNRGIVSKTCSLLS